MSTQIRESVPLNHLCSFRHKGDMTAVVDVESLPNLIEVLRAHPEAMILGKGSNTLLNPDNKSTVVVRLSSDFSPSIIQGEKMTVSAGTSVNRLMRLMKQHELSGLEFAAGVPAGIGGMVTMNFGCWGKEICDLVHRVHILDRSNMETRWVPAEEMGFAYRRSIVHEKPWVVLEVALTMTHRPASQIEEEIRKSIDLRLAKQPLRADTFGSTFKNPEGRFAGQIIEELGYRGRVFGAVQMSPDHANFMENCGGATFQEATDLIARIREDAQNKLGIELEPEVQIVD